MATPEVNTERHFVGLPVSGGVALARVCMFNEKRHSNLPAYKVSGDGAQREKQRLDKAVNMAGERLDVVIKDVEVRVGQHLFVVGEEALLADAVGLRERLRVVFHDVSARDHLAGVQ